MDFKIVISLFRNQMSTNESQPKEVEKEMSNMTKSLESVEIILGRKISRKELVIYEMFKDNDNFEFRKCLNSRLNAHKIDK